MKFIFHGAAREVGRSCIEVQTKGDRYILDCGVKFVTEGFEYPEKVFEVPKIDGVLISHAHLDHTGGLPFFEHFNLVCPIFFTHQTLAITKILLKDSYKIAHIKHLHAAWGKTDLKEVEKGAHRVEFEKWYKHRELKFMFLNAGHIPGSAMILLDIEGKRILYTGDFNTRTTRLMKPANFEEIAKNHGPIHTMITESTYGDRKLPPRKGLEPQFIKEIKRVIANGGSVLVPVFALGRAQEILIMLADHDFGCPIYFDGMAKEITRKVLNHQSTYVIHKEKLHKMLFDRVTLVGSQETRIEASQEQPAIFVTTSGMMQGGPAIQYLKNMWHDPKNAIFLTGYQVHGTNGRHLIDEGYVHIEGWKTPVKCEVQKFDFSGHADIDDIKKAIFTISPKQVIVQHGNNESVVNMLEWLRHETPFIAHGPAIGDEIEVK